MAENDKWELTNPSDDIWGEMFSDELDRERWRTNFGKDSEAAETASYWRDLVPGIEPSVAAIYHKEGMTPYEIGDYNQAGITDFKELLAWKRANAQPEVALAFKEKGINPDAYSKWVKIGVNDPDIMIKFSEDYKLELNQLEKYVKPLVDKELLTLQDIPKWLENGIPLQELQSWLDAGFKYPSLVKAWKALHMKPEDAKEWEKVVIYPREAARWIGAGYNNIEDIKGLIKQGYTSPEDLQAEADNLYVKLKS